jgi:hypothetical protein
MLGAVTVSHNFSVSFASHGDDYYSGGVEPPLTHNVVQGCIYNGVSSLTGGVDSQKRPMRGRQSFSVTAFGLTTIW